MNIDYNKIYADAESFKQVQAPFFNLGRSANKYLNLNLNNGKYVLSISDRVQDLVQVSFILSRFRKIEMAEKLVRGGYDVKSYEINAPEAQEGVDNVTKALDAFSGKVKKTYVNSCRFRLFTKALTDRLPMPLHRIDVSGWFKPQNNLICGSHNSFGGSTQIPFPLLNRTLRHLSAIHVNPNAEFRCSSCMKRTVCVVLAVFSLLKLAFFPIVCIYDAIKNNKHAQYRSVGHRIDDFVTTLVFSPVIYGIAAMKNLSAAIINPNIMLK